MGFSDWAKKNQDKVSYSSQQSTQSGTYNSNQPNTGFSNWARSTNVGTVKASTYTPVVPKTTSTKTNSQLYDQYAADIQAYHDATAIRQPLAFGASGATSNVDTTGAKQKYDAAVKGLKSMGATDEDIYNIEHSNARKYTNEAIKKVLLRSDADIQKAVEQQKMSEAERERRKTTNLSDIQRSIDEQQKIVDAERGKSSANIRAMGGYDPTQVTMAQKRLAELKQEYNLTQQVQQEEKDKKTIADVDKLPTEANEAVKALIDIRNDPNNAQYKGKPAYSGLDMQLMSMLHSMGYSGEYIQEVMQAYEREGNRVKSEEQRDKYLNDAVRNPVGASVKSVGTNLGSGFGYLENVGDLMSGRPVDYNNLGNRMGQYTQGVRGAVSENLAQQHPFSIAGTNVSSFLYQTGMSMADSSVVAAMSLAGLPEAYGLVLLGGAAANQTMQDAHARGLDDTQAATLGLVAGAAEVITEKVSLDTLLDAAGWNKNAAKQYLKQVLAEGSEEVGADLINWMADVLVSKEQSEWEQSIQNHVAQGDDVRTAFGKAFGEQAGQMVGSFVGGALSGGVFGVGGLTYNASNRIQQNRAFDQALNKLYAADPKSMVQTGLTAESGSQFRQLSDKYNKVLEDGGELNADDIRQLSTAAAENWLTDKGSAENAAAVAESIAKKQAGEKLNRQDKKNLKSPAAKSYLENAARGSIFRTYGNEVSNDTAEGENASESATGASVAIKNAVLRDAVTKARNGESVTSSIVKNIAANEEAMSELGIDTNGMTASEIRTEVRSKVESIASGEAQNVIQNPTTEAVETESASAEYVSNDAITAVAKEYDMSEDSVRDIRDMFKGNMTSEQLRGATQAYRMGRFNIPASEMDRYNVAQGLTKEQRAYAYNRGAIDNKSSVSKAQNAKKVIKNAKGKGGLVYEGIEDPTKKGNLNAQQRTGLRVAEALSQWAGGTVHVYESVVKDGKRVMAVDIPDAGIKAGESAPNGMYIHSSGEIWIDLAAGQNGEGVILYTLAHEYTHMIRAWSPAKFDTLAKFLFDQYASNGVSVSELIARQQEKAKKNGRTIPYDEAYEEVVADAMERMLADEHFADRIAELKKTDKSLWEKLKDLFKRLIDALGKANKAYKDIAPTTIEAYEVSHFTKAAQEHLTKLYAEAFVDAAEARSSAEVVMAEENESIVPQDDHEGEMSPEDGDIAFSIREKDNIEARSVKYRDAHKDQSSHISDSAFKAANDIINEMAEYMKPFLDKQNKTGKRYLPEEILGKTTFKNGSYGKTIENTTICFRTLAYIDFTNEIKERIGRPLTVEESFLASQMLYDIAKEPQCLYCYVSLDRKAYDEFLLEYTKQRDGVIEKYNALDNKSKANVDALYKEFLNGRKDTKPMRVRFDLWINTAKNGGKFVTNADLTTEEKRSLLKNGGGDLSKQIIDAEKYAQGASWAKKLEQYRSYNSDILSMSATMVNKLNKHYGLRFYSFSEYTPAFIVENMQQIRDASLKGLFGLAYTKKTDFARIFAGTGMNINISTFGRMENGKVVPDTLQGADWEEVKQLRKEHKNVGAVFVATNDEMTEWALAQDWIDVVIPFHIVRTGANVAEFYKWVNNTKDQADVDASGKNKTISPAEFHNDYDTYMSLIKERGLTPRFSKWLKNPNYMKLVNETRLSDLDSEKLHPDFDIGAAKKSFDAFTEDGGYYGNWYEDGIDYEDAVNTVANDIKAGKRANEVEYGRQDFDASVAMRNRKNRQHGQRVSLSDRDSEGKRMEDDIAFSAREALSLDIPWDKDNFSSLKEQLIAHQDEINNTKIIANVEYDENSPVPFYDRLNTILKKNFGYKISRPDISDILFDKTAISNVRRYNIKSNGAKAAVIASPYIVKRGKMITGHKNHENNGYPSITFAGRASLNGEVGNIAVAVLFANKDRVHALKILAPDGSEFVLPIKKEASSEREGVPEKTVPRTPTELTSDSSIPQTAAESQAESSDNNRGSYRDADSLDNQTLLTNAKSAKTAEEKDMLNSYMSTAKSLNYQEEKLTGIMEEIRSLDPTQDAKKIAALEREGYTVRKVIEQRHNRLVQLERTKALRDLVKRERSMAVAKQRQKGETALAAQAARSKAKQDAIIEKYRTQRDEAVAKVREKSAQREQEIKDTYRERIKNGVENRKASSLRESIRKTANDFRQMILHATDSKYAPTELMQSCLDVALMLDTSGEREDTKSKQKFRDAMEAIREIKSQYEELQNNPDSDYRIEYDHDFAYMVGQLEKSINGKAVRDLTLDELQSVHDILHDIKEMLNGAKFQIGKAEKITNYSVGESIIRDMGNVGTRTKAEQALDAQFRLTGSTLRNIRRISNYDDNAALVRLFNDLNDGIKKKNQFIMEAEKMFDQFTVNSKRYKQSINEVKDYKTGGRTFKLTEMEAIQLVLTWERERGGKTNHLERDGAVIPNHELLKKGKYADAFTNGTEYDHITEDEIMDIQKSFDEWANNYKAVAKTFFNVKAKTAINNTTLLTKHRAVALENNYIPIEVDRNNIAAELEGVKFDATIDGMGMLKSVKEGAGNPIIIRGLHDVVRRHAESVGQFSGLAVPIRNFNKAYGVELVGSTMTVKKAIGKSWGDADIKLIEQAITDLQTARPREKDGLIDLADKAQSNFVKATLLSNISVTIKQAASYSTAGLYLSQKALAPYQGTIAKIFANNESKFAKDLFAEIDAHTSEHYIRRKGMSMQEISTIANDTGKVVGWMDETLPDAANPLKWIQNMDVATTAALWLAAKKQVELDGIKPSDSSYWKKVTALYEKVIEDTQPMYDVLHRPEIQKKQLLKYVIMFKTQPLQNSGILYNAAGELAHAKKSGNQQAIAKASKQMKMAVGSQVASLAVFAAMTFLAYAVRNRLGRYKDKDEELTVWSVMGRVLGDMAGNGAALLLPIGGSTLSGNIEKKITGSHYGGEISVPLFDMINDYIKSYEKVFGDISDWDSKKGDFAEDLMSLSMDTAGMFGIPANNVYNIVRGVIGNVTDIAGVPLDWATDKSKNYSTQMYNAAIRGDTAKEEKARANYDTEKAADDAFRGEVMKSYEKGKINRDQAIKLLMEHGGMKKDAAEEKILNADFKKEYGFSYSDLGEKYIEGVITKEQYKSIQKEHGFKDDEISKKLLDLDFKAKYGFSYDDKREAYWDGDISKADITKALIAHGKTQDEADDIIKCWDFTKGENGMDDISVSAVKNYNEICAPAGVSKRTFYDAWAATNGMKGEDLDGDGKNDAYTAIDKKLAYIATLPISSDQKYALAISFRGSSSEKTVYKRAHW